MCKVITDPIELLRRDGGFIRLFQNQTEEMQLTAVKDRPRMLPVLKKPSKKVQLAAVKEWGSMLKHIENQTEEIQLAAVKNDGLSIKYVKNPSEKVKLAAVKEDGNALDLIPNPSDELKAAAKAELEYRERDVTRLFHVVKIEDKIKVGCETRTKEEWLKTTEEEIGEKHGPKYAKLLKSLQEIVKEL